MRDVTQAVARESTRSSRGSRGKRSSTQARKRQSRRPPLPRRESPRDVMPCLCRHKRQAQSMRYEYCKPLGSPVLATWARKPSRPRRVKPRREKRPWTRGAAVREEGTRQKFPPEESTAHSRAELQNHQEKAATCAQEECRARRRRKNSNSRPPLHRRRVAPLRTTPMSRGVRNAPGILQGSTGAPCACLHLAALKVGIGYVLV